MKVFLPILHEVTGSVFVLLRANRIVSGKLDALEKGDPALVYKCDRRSALSQNVLMRHLEEEFSRQLVIEEKAKTNVLGITLAFGAMFAGAAFISSSSAVGEMGAEWLNWVFLGLFFIGVLFLLIGGVLALSSLRIARIYTWTSEDEVNNITDKDRAVRVLWYMDLNQETTRLKVNKVYASYSCIRNGVIALAVTAMFMAFSNFQP